MLRWESDLKGLRRLRLPSLAVKLGMRMPLAGLDTGAVEVGA